MTPTKHCIITHTTNEFRGSYGDQKTTTTNEEKFKKALEEIAAGNAMDKYDLAIQIATKALEDVSD